MPSAMTRKMGKSMVCVIERSIGLRRVIDQSTTVRATGIAKDSSATPHLLTTASVLAQYNAKFVTQIPIDLL